MQKKHIAHRILQYLTIIWICLLTTLVSANESPLTADRAFVFSVEFKNAQEIITKWKIAPGYYLYRDKFQFNFQPKIPAQIQYPKAESKTDLEGKQLEVYSGSLQIPIKLVNHQSLLLRITYQGCSKAGFCYPPIHKKITLNLQNQTSLQMKNIDSSPQQQANLHTLLTDQNSVRALFNLQHLGIQLLIFVLLGLLLAFTPCVLPMIPILTGIIVGQEKKSTKKTFFLALSYTFGMALTYALAGLVAASLGSSLQVWVQKPLFIILGSSLFVLLALSLFGLYHLRLPHRLHNKIVRWSHRHQGGTYLSVFLMGVLSTLVVSPCVTAPLIGVLIYMGQTGNMLLGGSALFAMGVGMGIPLLLIAVSAGKWLPRSGPWMEAVKKIFGMIMLAMAVWLLARIVPPFVTRLLLGLLLIGFSFFLSWYLSRLIGLTQLNYSVGIISGLFGLFLIVTTFIPFTAPTTAPSSFITVHNLKELDKQLSFAKASHRPVLLDFYADWCESCIIMDKKVFAQSDVRQTLDPFILLRADLTENSKADEVLLKYFNVIAPPTVLFLKSDGQEDHSRRIVGEVDKHEFIMRVNTFVTAYCDKNMTC